MSWLDGPISAYITNIELYNGQGDYRIFDQTDNSNIFNLFRYHLGLCGVFTQLTIQVGITEINLILQLYTALSTF